MPQLSAQQLFDLALQHHRSGRLQEAERLYNDVLVAQPQHVDAIQNLGIIAQELGRLEIAVNFIRRAIALRPNYAEAHSNLGNLLNTLGRSDEAIAACRRAINLRPDLPEAHSNLSAALAKKGQFDQAIAAARQAIALRPGFPEAHVNAGVALAAKGRLDEAADEFRQAISRQPNYTQAYGNLGNVLREQGNLDQAISCYRQALALTSQDAEIHNSLGIALADQGLLDEAIGSYRMALKFNPDHFEAHSNLILACLYRFGDQSSTILREARAWSDRHARKFAPKNRTYKNDPSPQRLLRIGYLSADFRHHPVGYFIDPLLKHHDRKNFCIYGYSNSGDEDDQTKRIKRHCNAWRKIAGLDDEKVAEQIAEDQIDILVDLSAHTRGHRLLVMARKPAPVQLTYLAYPGTTGLDTIDYRLTDPHLDPPGAGEGCYTEKTIRLPRTYWCYEPPIRHLELSSPPSSRTGFITFGCLNSFSKVSPAAMQTWSEILAAVPGSRLLLHALQGSHRDRVIQTLGLRGIKPDRVEFIGWLSLADYMAQFRRIDIALDTFPYAGGMTTCHSLWMGVPVVTLAGPTCIGRGGVSILGNLDLDHFIASSPAHYVHIAAALASEPRGLMDLRTGTRQAMRDSPLMDARQFAADVENTYRRIWQQWSTGGSPQAA